MLPTFFVVGAAKCATTSLHFYLDLHPEIEMSSVKEPHVYGRPLRMQARADYDGLFARGCRVRGESSTGYARYPAEGDAAARIAVDVPEAKIIYLVREPLSRIVSDYVQQVAVGAETRSLDAALESWADPANFYVCASLYATQLRRYLAHFPSSHILVVEQAELRDHRAATLRKVFAFLDVDPDFTSPDFAAELATREDHVRYGSTLWTLRISALGQAWRRLPVRPRLRLSRLLRRRAAVERPEVKPAIRAGLAARLAEETAEFRELVGSPLPHLDP